MSISVAIPAQATLTVSSPPTLSIDQATGEITINSLTWSDNGAGASRIRACPSQISAQSTATTSYPNAVSECASLYLASDSLVPATNLNSAYFEVPAPIGGVTQTGNYSDLAASKPFIVHAFIYNASPNFVWSASVEWLGAGSSSTTNEAPAPSYAGPKISSFNLSSVAAGGSLVATGKRLNTVQSATIGGLAAGITASADGMEISVPEALLPGTYDLVMQTSHGVLTHINAVVVRAKPELSVITIRGTGNSISEDLATELAAISELHSSGYNKIHCLVNMADASAAEAIAAAACDLLKLGSLADATTLTTLKSSFKGSGFWLRIYMAG